jgi:hypothetical protein
MVSFGLDSDRRQYYESLLWDLGVTALIIEEELGGGGDYRASERLSINESQEDAERFMYV